MEDLWNKIGAIVGALITSLGGLYLYDRNTTNDRLTKVEKDLAKQNTDIKVIEVKFSELKEDTADIKESQKAIIALLTELPKRRK